MNLQDMLADRQIALMQNRKQISVGQNPNTLAVNPATTLPQASRPAPPPPSSNHLQARSYVQLGDEIDQTSNQALIGNENAAIGVPGASDRSPKVAIGPNGKPLVQPQAGSKEDVRRRKAMKEERERQEAIKQLQAGALPSKNTSPTSWFTASSNTVASPNQLHPPRPTNGSTSPSGSGSASSNSQRSALSFNATKRTPAHLVVNGRSGGSSSCESGGSGSSGDRRRTSYSTLVTVPNRQPGLIVEEDEDDLDTPTPPEIKLEKERQLAAMFVASGIGAVPPIAQGRPRSYDEGEEDEAGQIEAAIVMRMQGDSDQLQRQQAASGVRVLKQTMDEASQTRNSADTTTSREFANGTDTDGSLKTPTTAEFRNRNTDLIVGSTSNENDSSVSIPTIISSSADEEIVKKDSNGSDFQTFIKGFSGTLGQKARIVSDMGRKLSGMIVKGDLSSPSTPSGSRRPSISSSFAASDVGADALPKPALARAAQRDLWKLDSLATHCDFSSCEVEFNLRARKHHCRYCGGIFCDVHSAYSLPLYFPPIEADDEDCQSNQAPTLNLSAIATRITGGVANSRVCVTCFEKLAHPEKLLARRAAAKGVKTRPLVLDKQHDLPSTDEEDSDDSDGDADNDRETFEEYQARKQRRKAMSTSNMEPRRRMFSAPVTPMSRSPPKPALEGYMINSANVSPRASLRHNKTRVRTNPGSRAQSRSGTTLSRQASLSSTARKVFSPTVEAMNPNSCSPAEGSNRNSYFPAMPPPGMPHLPGEEPHTTVSGILATYPLAHKAVTSPSSPYTPQALTNASLLSFGGLAGPGRSPDASISRESSRSRSQAQLTIQNMPPMGLGALDHLHQKLQHSGNNGTSTNTNSSAGLLTPDREWVPSAWGYDRETFDPEREIDTDDEASVQRGRTKLVIDGDFRFKANPSPGISEDDDDRHSRVLSGNGNQRNTNKLAWATF